LNAGGGRDHGGVSRSDVGSSEDLVVCWMFCGSSSYTRILFLILFSFPPSRILFLILFSFPYSFPRGGESLDLFLWQHKLVPENNLPKNMNACKLVEGIHHFQTTKPSHNFDRTKT
jgi:hypothetical protein